LNRLTGEAHVIPEFERSLDLGTRVEFPRIIQVMPDPLLPPRDESLNRGIEWNHAQGRTVA
jgi:hypothetical protein